MQGQTVSHFRIIEQLPWGTFGDLYKAEDTRLGRTVALKILPVDLAGDEKARARFLHEAKAAGSLDHPHIPPVHEVGQTEDGRLFLALGYTPGVSLQAKLAAGPLPAHEALRITAQVAEALQAAHEKGIVHRDITPRTIVVGEDGNAKLLDFGLADLAGAERLSRTADASGSTGYLSPEQLEGKDGDSRSDIWSLGAVLTACTRESTGDVQRVVKRCMAKDPRDRYASAREVVADLETVGRGTGTLRVRPPRRRRVLLIGAGAAVLLVAAALMVMRAWQPWEPKVQDRVTIALLPLEGTGLTAEDAWYAEGVSASLTTELVKIGGLRVISQNSARLFTAADDVREVGKRLRCDFVATGTVAKSGDAVTTGLAVTRVRDARRVWEREFTRRNTGLFGRLGEEARAIGRAAGVRPTAEEAKKLAGENEVSAEAYELFLKGDALFRGLDAEGFRKAFEYLEKAVRLEPTWAKAWETLAEAYYAATFFTPPGMDRGELRRKSEAAQEVLNGLEPSNLRLNSMLTRRAMDEFDWVKAMQYDELSAAVDPMFSNPNVYLAQKRFDEAFANAEEVLRREPTWHVGIRCAGIPYYYARHFDRAVELWEEVLRMVPESSLDMRNLGACYCAMGRIDEGISLLENALARGAYHTEFWLGNWYARTGNTEAARSSLARALEDTGYPIQVASIYAGFGDAERAVEYLEKQFNLDKGEFYLLPVEPTFDPIRSDERFKAFLRKCNLPVD